MQEEHPRPRRFVGIGRKVSLFFLTAVLGVIGVILLVSYKQGAFVRYTAIHFYAADAFGISKGMAVRLFGLPVGNVSDLDISDRGGKMQLALHRANIPRRPEGAHARPGRQGYCGGGALHDASKRAGPRV